MENRWRILWAWSLVAASIMLCAAAHWRLDYTVIDDAFITYRYSARFAVGDGLTYNDGERVLGTTTPGYALLLGGAAVLTDVSLIPVMSRALNLVLLLIAGGCAVGVTSVFTRDVLVQAFVFSLFLLSPKTLIASFSGMENALFMALTAATFLAFVKKRWLWMALLLGLLPLVRPEGVFLMGIFVLWGVWQRKSLPNLRTLWICCLLALLPGVLWTLSATLYYGSPIPHSITAKQAGLYPIGMIGSLLSLAHGLAESFFLMQIVVNPFSRLLAIGLLSTFLFTLLIPLLVVIGGRWLTKLHPALLVIPTFIIILLVFYATSETIVFPQYLGHFEAPAKICVWVGLVMLLKPLRERFPKATWTLAGTIVLFPSFYFFPWNSVLQPTTDLREMEISVMRQPVYRALSQQLNPRLPAGTVILMSEIGELGFYLDDAFILDSAGLVSPQTIPYLPVPEEFRNGPGVIPPDLVRDYEPDLLIFLDNFAQKGILDADWFHERYTAVVVWEYDWLPIGAEALYVFSRNDFAAGLALQNETIVMDAPMWTTGSP